MSAWDKILPHRFLLNRALRTASDELREHIDSYRAEHEQAIRRCHYEIEAAKAEKDRQFELLKQEYLKELGQDSHALDELQSLFLAYVNEYMESQLLSLNKEKMTLEWQLCREYSDYLKEQRNLLGEEIMILNQRQEVLVTHTKIDDVVALIGMTGCSLPCDGSDTPKTLLEKVQLELSECNDLLPQTRAALLRLRMLLQERAEYLPLIQYVSWLIQQKKKLKEELHRERCGIQKEKDALKIKISAIKAEQKRLKETMLSQAAGVRNVWAGPMADIYRELSKIVKTLNGNHSRINDIRSKIDDIQSQIDDMKRAKSDDSNRWERLWDEKKSLLKEKKSLSNEIGQLKKERTEQYERLSQWFGIEKTVMDLCKTNGVFLLRPKGEKNDVIRILKWQRSGICGKIESWNRSLENDISQIQNECSQKEILLSGKIRAAQEMVSGKRIYLVEAKKQVDKCKAKDDRFFIVQLFSESEDVIQAKRRQDVAEKELEQAEERLSVLQNELREIKNDRKQRELNVRKRYECEKNELQESVSNIDLAIAFIREKKRSIYGSKI